MTAKKTPIYFVVSEKYLSDGSSARDTEIVKVFLTLEKAKKYMYRHGKPVDEESKDDLEDLQDECTVAFHKEDPKHSLGITYVLVRNDSGDAKEAVEQAIEEHFLCGAGL